jgi:hypothetical protein
MVECAQDAAAARVTQTVDRPDPLGDLDPLGDIDRLDPGAKKMASRAILRCGLQFCALLLLSTAGAAAQSTTSPAQTKTGSDQMAGMSGTSTDLWVMPGSDFDRPGLVPRANLNIGIGHTFGFLKKDPIGDELTFGYTYENAGSHGFFHTSFGSHTEALGVMKNFNLPHIKVVSGYTCIQAGIASFTGNAYVQNRLYDGEALGAMIHFGPHESIWIQEMYNKMPTMPWYTTTSIGYTWSW